MVKSKEYNKKKNYFFLSLDLKALIEGANLVSK